MLTVLQGDCRDVLKTLPDESVYCCVSSPPYWGLRDYGVADQIGLERTPEEYVAQLVAVFREVRRVLRRDGTLWLNLGDSYARMQEDNVPQTKNKPVQPPSMVGREPCILAGCPIGGTVLDPFAGSGTVGRVALSKGRQAVLIELNPEYCKLIDRRCETTYGLQFVGGG